MARESENRLAKSLLYGVPIDSGLTREEQILRTLTHGLKEMRQRLPQHQGSASQTPSAFSPQSSAIAATPGIDVHVPDPSSALRPYLEDVADRQRETTSAISALGIQGQKSVMLQQYMAKELRYQGGLSHDAWVQRQDLLKHSRLAVSVLDSLEEQGQHAYLQRLSLIFGLREAKQALEQIDSDVVHGFSAFGRRVRAFQAQTALHDAYKIAELRKHTSLLDEIADLEDMAIEESRTQTDALFRIDGSLEELLACAHMHDERAAERFAIFISAFNALSTTVSRATETLEDIEHHLSVIAVLQMQAQRQLRAIAEVASHPIHTRAFELWKIGEKCRRAGDTEHAMRFFNQSCAENPTEPRNYYSLAMLSLELPGIGTAQNFLSTGFKYAQNSPQIAAYFLMHSGKLAYLRGQYGEAKELLERGLSMDRKNMEIWHELALAEKKLGNADRAIYYLRNLVYAGQRIAPAYCDKVKSEPEFSEFLPRLNL